MNRLISKIFFILCLVQIIPALSQEYKQIEIVNAGSLESDNNNKEIRKLIGNVVLKHEEALIYCDSVYMNPLTNSIQAFGHVHLTQGDSVHLYGDSLRYNGKTKLAEVRGEVSLVNNEGATLRTHFLNYDRVKNTGYYFNNGEIVDNENNLKSRNGFYYSHTHDFVSVDSVVLTNPDYVMYSDTLKYNTTKKIAFFLGPTEIISDSGYIYCENGWYNTVTDISQYNENALIRNKGQTLKGDSLYYDREKGFGKAIRHVELIDTAENIILRGNYAIYYENPEYSLITDSALMIQISDGDSLFMHSDTLVSCLDSSQKNKIIRAFHKVKMFKSDMQGKCDSLVYTLSDSVIHLFHSPVLWSEKNQLTAEYMEIHSKNRQMDHIILHLSSFITSQEDTIRFNQIKGKNMTGFFRNNELYRIDIEGNGQTIYFPKEEDEGNGKLIGVNKAISSDLIIFLEDNEVRRIKFIMQPEGTLYPVDQVTSKDLLLEGFQWLEKYRPKNRNDIFSW